ncbi:MAG: hypothetical protein SXA11_06495 [Cyanobacteriota bacterium]|nr:hypothetical protein [Cyanobacteriota bacterium]
MLNSIILIQPYLAGAICQNPNPLEWVLIVALVGGCVVFSGAGAVAIASVAGTMVSLIIAGSSLATIAAAVTGDAALAGGALEIIAGMVIAIKGILGC